MHRLRVAHRVGAHVVGAALEAAAGLRVQQRAAGEPARQRQPRRRRAVAGAVGEVGGDQTRVAEAGVVPDRVERGRGLDLERVAHAGLELPVRPQVAHEIAVHGRAAGADRPLRALEQRRGPGGAPVPGLGAVEQVQAGHRARRLALRVQLEFLRALPLAEVALQVEQHRRQAVHVQHRLRVALAPSGDRTQAPAFAPGPVHHQRGAGAVEVELLRVAAAHVVAAGIQRHLRGIDVRRDHAEPVPRPRSRAVAVAVERQPHLQIGRRRPQRAPARDLRVAARGPRAGVQVVAEAVMVVAGDRQARAQRLRHRQVEREAAVAASVVARGEREPPAEAGFGSARHHPDRAAHRVAPVQRALRAAQHFHPLHVEHVEQRALRPGHVHVVDVDRHARLGAPDRIGLADTADVGGGAAVDRARRMDHQSRRHQVERVDVGGAHRLEFVAAHGGDRGRHLAQRLAVAARGDQDPVELGRRPRRGRWRGGLLARLRARLRTGMRQCITGGMRGGPGDGEQPGQQTSVSHSGPLRGSIRIPPPCAAPTQPMSMPPGNGPRGLARPTRPRPRPPQGTRDGRRSGRLEGFADPVDFPVGRA